MIGKNLALRIFESSYIQRWNDKIRPVELAELDKNSHKMIIAYCLGKYEEAAGKQVNWNAIIRGGIFELLRRTVLSDNILDLMAPFRSKYYYTRKMQGSYSIKSVLPALIPGQCYDGMAICNGGEAMNAYATLHLVKDKAELAGIRKALLDYCKLDTLAMVMLLEKLRTVIKK